MINRRNNQPRGSGAPSVHLALGVHETIRQHISIYPDREVGGVLLGHTVGVQLTVNAIMPGFQAEGPGYPVTVTPGAWQAISRELERYPQQRIVGWYHSHRTAGPLLSVHDRHVIGRYFNSPEQVTLIVESDGEETWFRSDAGKIVRLGAFGPHRVRAVTPAPRKPAVGALWGQRAACALVGVGIGCAGWVTLIRTDAPAVPVPSSHVRSAMPVAHPIVVEPQAGVNPGSTSAGG